MKKLPVTPSYDDVVTKRQTSILNKFMKLFDFSNMIEDTPEYATGTPIFCQGYNDYMSHQQYDISYNYGTKEYEEYNDGWHNALNNVLDKK